MTDQPTIVLPGHTLDRQPAKPARMSRRRFAATAAMAPVAGLALAQGFVGAQDIVSTQTGDTPTTGGMRPGPAGMAPAPVTRNRGVLPTAIRIDKFGVDAPIEVLQIVDGIMQNPNGPFVVGWYRETARLGEIGNPVVAGHVDYYNVGPAVFYGIKEPGIEPGDQVTMVGENGAIYTYETIWAEEYDVASLTSETIETEIVGANVEPVGERNLTMITCGGTFDTISGEYLSRIIVRLTQVDVQQPS